MTVVENTVSVVKVKKKYLVLFIAAMIVFVLVRAFVLPPPWSRLNCWEYQMDINSGKEKYCRYFFYIKVKESPIETEFSRILAAETKDNAPDWHIVSCFSPGVTSHSPHYRFHGASSQRNILESLWSMFPGSFPEEKDKKESAEKLLELWQKTGSYYKAGDYLNSLSRELMDRQKTKR